MLGSFVDSIFELEIELLGSLTGSTLDSGSGGRFFSGRLGGGISVLAALRFGLKFHLERFWVFGSDMVSKIYVIGGCKFRETTEVIF